MVSKVAFQASASGRHFDEKKKKIPGLCHLCHNFDGIPPLETVAMEEQNTAVL